MMDRLSPAARKKQQQYNREHYQKRRIIYLAKRAVEKALREGNLYSEPCIICGETKTSAHHEDYNHFLDVIWLCHAHHMALHSCKRRGLTLQDFIDIGGDPRWLYRQELLNKVSAMRKAEIAPLYKGFWIDKLWNL